MKEVVVSLSESRACLYSPGSLSEIACAGFGPEDSASLAAKQVGEGLGFGFKGKRLVLAADSRKTIIRIASAKENTLKRGLFGKRLGNENAWEVIKEVFPFGPAINEDSHVFDISLFGERTLACFGLPADVCARLADMGSKLSGSLHRVKRLEAIEHLLFRKICKDGFPHKDCIAVFHQDGGLRVLVTKDRLPEGAFFVSNHPTRREEEFLRILDSLEGRREIVKLGGVEKQEELNWINKFHEELRK